MNEAHSESLLLNEHFDFEENSYKLAQNVITKNRISILSLAHNYEFLQHDCSIISEKEFIDTSSVNINFLRSFIKYLFYNPHLLSELFIKICNDDFYLRAFCCRILPSIYGFFSFAEYLEYSQIFFYDILDKNIDLEYVYLVLTPFFNNSSTFRFIENVFVNFAHDFSFYFIDPMKDVHLSCEKLLNCVCCAYPLLSSYHQKILKYMVNSRQVKRNFTRFFLNNFLFRSLRRHLLKSVCYKSLSKLDLISDTIQKNEKYIDAIFSICRQNDTSVYELPSVFSAFKVFYLILILTPGDISFLFHSLKNDLPAYIRSMNPSDFVFGEDIDEIKPFIVKIYPSESKFEGMYYNTKYSLFSAIDNTTLHEYLYKLDIKSHLSKHESVCSDHFNIFSYTYTEKYFREKIYRKKLSLLFDDSVIRSYFLYNLVFVRQLYHFLALDYIIPKILQNDSISEIKKKMDSLFETSRPDLLRKSQIKFNTSVSNTILQKRVFEIAHIFREFELRNFPLIHSVLLDILSQIDELFINETKNSVIEFVISLCDSCTPIYIYCIFSALFYKREECVGMILKKDRDSWMLFRNAICSMFKDHSMTSHIEGLECILLEYK